MKAFRFPRGARSFRRILLLALAAGLPAFPVRAGDFFVSGAWRPVGRSPAVETATDGSAVFPCAFATSGSFGRRRALQKISWKREVSADWRNASGFVFSFDAVPPLPENALVLEIRLLSPAGGDWRTQKLLPARGSELRFPRAAFRPVGEAGPFGEVAGVQICLSPLAGADKPSLFRRLFPVKQKQRIRPRAWDVSADGRLCVLTVPGGERGADELSSSLFAAGFPHLVRPAAEAEEALAAAEAAVVFFPAPPAKPLREALCAFLARGGRLGAFYDCGPVLASAMGFRSGRFRRVPGGGVARGFSLDASGVETQVLSPRNHWIEGAPRASIVRSGSRSSRSGISRRRRKRIPPAARGRKRPCTKPSGGFPASSRARRAKSAASGRPVPCPAGGRRRRRGSVPAGSTARISARARG